MILASQSPRRIELLRDAGFDPSVRPASVDEAPRRHERPLDLVERLARSKARACWLGTGEADRGQIIVAADTIVWIGDAVLGKPRDDGDARDMLRRLSGKTHHVSTGVQLIKADIAPFPGIRDAMVPMASFVETTDVTFYQLTDAQIEAYVSTGEPADKAGAYGIQGVGRTLVRRIEGDYYNVVGLPVSRLVREMDRLTRDDSFGFTLRSLGGTA
ncbi:MAG: Maf family protein [Atopobiaceae bacterium]|jgi:septum formation protein|nr:Maf family protein [Atopobiaceae bacterium]